MGQITCNAHHTHSTAVSTRTLMTRRGPSTVFMLCFAKPMDVTWLWWLRSLNAQAIAAVLAYLKIFQPLGIQHHTSTILCQCQEINILKLNLHACQDVFEQVCQKMFPGVPYGSQLTLTKPILLAIRMMACCIPAPHQVILRCIMSTSYHL